MENEKSDSRVYLIRQILNHITGYFHWAQTLKFGGMQQWKKTSYSLTNQEFLVIINFQSIKTNLDSCQISSKFSFIITLARWVFFWRFSHRELHGGMLVFLMKLRELFWVVLYFFLMVTYWVTHVVFIMMPACRLSLHETASISRWVNAKYVYTNIYLTSSL